MRSLPSVGMTSPRVILLALLILLAWNSRAPMATALDKNRRAATVLRYTVEGCAKDENCVLREAALQVYFRIKRKATIILKVEDGHSSKLYQLTLVRNGWRHLDVKSVTLPWVHKPGKSERRLNITCYCCKGKVKPVVGSRSPARKPKLIWKLDRVPRGPVTPGKNGRYCELRPGKRLDVKYVHQIWGDVIAMPGSRSILVNECRGVCDFTDQKSAGHSDHALLLERMRISGYTSWRTPCCVPTKFDPVPVLTKENGYIEQKNLTIIVKECGCL